MNKNLLLAFSLLILALKANCLVKIWKPSTTTIWSNTKCTEKIRFESNFYSVVNGPEKAVTTNEINLPENGGMVLGENSIFEFKDESSEKSSKSACEQVVSKPKLEKWFSTQNWAPIFTNDVQTFNKATPDSEKIPCAGDVAVFPANVSFNVDLQFAYRITVHDVKISEQLQGEGFRDFLQTETGQLMFINGEESVVETNSCDSDKNCPCPVDTPLCRNFEGLCAEPHCSNPIQPLGFCCPICGAFIRFTVGNRNRLDTKGLAERVKQVLRNSRFDKDAIEYYVSLTSETSAQLVIVDKEDYSEISPAVAEYLKINLINLKFPNATEGFLVSGSPYEPLSDKNLISSMFVPLIIIMLAFGLIYFFYYDETTIPRVFAMARIRQINPVDFVFARFDRQASTAGSEAAIGLNPNVQEVDEVATGFDNPMFEAHLDLKEASPPKVDDEKQAEKVVDTKFVDVDLLGES